MSPNDIPAVENADALLEIFGAWPSFHDAEVIALRLDRTGDAGPVLDVQIHVFAMSDRVDEQGYYVLTNHTLVTFRFTDVNCVELSGFNGQNSLWDLGFDQV